MRKNILAIALMVVLMAATVAVNAWTIDDAIIEAEVGSGDATSYLVVDFGAASYAFKYNYNSNTAKTGMDLITDIRSANIGFDFSDSYGFIDRIAYGSYDQTSDWNADGTFWSYWTGTTGGSLGSASTGAGGRALSNNTWDGWSWGTDTTIWPEPQPDIPGVPEPSSLMAMCSLIGLTASAKLLRYRSK